MIARRDFLRDAVALGAASLAGWRAFAAEEGLPAYYGDYLAGIAAKVKARVSKSRDAFWFFTDPHVPDNRRMSGRVLAKLVRETGVRKVFCGGDIPGAFGSRQALEEQMATFRDEWMRPIEEAGGRFYLAKGNHDFTVRRGMSNDGFTFDGRVARDYIMGTKAAKSAVANAADPECAYYYVDEARSRVRYIVVDSTDAITEKRNWWAVEPGVRERQLAWLRDKAFGTLPKGFGCVVIHHIPVAGVVGSPDDVQTFSKFRELLNANTNRIFLDLTGHHHREVQTFQSGLWHVTEPCDAAYRDYIKGGLPWCPNLPEKRAGTVFENTFDAVFLGKDGRRVDFVRVGGGADRSLVRSVTRVKAGATVRMKTSLGAVKWGCYDADRVDYRPDPDNKWGRLIEYRSNVAKIDAEGVLSAFNGGESVVVALASDGRKELFPVTVTAAAGEIVGTSLDWKITRNARIEGNILVVDVPKGHEKDGGGAVAWVDLSSINGQCFSASVNCRGEDISKPAESWNGLKFQFEFKNETTGEMMYPNTKSRLGTFAEEMISTTVADAGGRLAKVKLTLGLQSSSGKAVFDLSTLRIRSGCDIYPMVNEDYRVSYPQRVKSMPQLKGVMLPADSCKEDDFRTLKSWGATLARYQMVRNWNAKNADRELDDYMRWLDGKLDHLDRDVLPWAEKYGIRIVVDLHVPPGGKNGGDMNMFYEQKYNDAFVECWRRIARRFRGRRMIYGYDLINEPQQTDRAVCDYWNTQRRAAEAVREIDPDVTIVMESNGWDSPGTYSYLSPLAMDNVIYQVHMYEPFVYTHQGVNKGFARAVYPDEAKGWNRDYLRRRLGPVLEFQRRHGARIYVGEFSAAAWAPGAERYLADLISIFNEYGWDWTYHAFREWPGWSVEHEGPDMRNMQKAADTPRMRVLKKGFVGLAP